MGRRLSSHYFARDFTDVERTRQLLHAAYAIQRRLLAWLDKPENASFKTEVIEGAAHWGIKPVGSPESFAAKRKSEAVRARLAEAVSEEIEFGSYMGDSAASYLINQSYELLELELIGRGIPEPERVTLRSVWWHKQSYS